MLEPQDRIGEEEPHKAEKNQRTGILLPVLLLGQTDSEEPIRQPLQRFQNRVQPGFPRRIQNPDQVKPHRFGEKSQEADEKGQLQPSVAIRHDEIPFLIDFILKYSNASTQSNVPWNAHGLFRTPQNFSGRMTATKR